MLVHAYICNTHLSVVFLHCSFVCLFCILGFCCCCFLFVYISINQIVHWIKIFMRSLKKNHQNVCYFIIIIILCKMSKMTWRFLWSNFSRQIFLKIVNHKIVFLFYIVWFLYTYEDVFYILYIIKNWIHVLIGVLVVSLFLQLYLVHVYRHSMRV